MTKRTLIAALAIVLISPIASPAGTGYPMKCKDCGYSSLVQIGGGKGFEQITGYCTESGKFVSVTWKRGTKKPEPMGKVWDAATGNIIGLYKCSDCNKPFMPLRANTADRHGPGFDHCPRCGKQTFELEKGKGIMMFD